MPWVPQANGNTDRDTHHTDPTCPRVRENHVEKSPDVIEQMGTQLCKFCSDDVDYPEERRISLRELVKSDNQD